MKRSRKRVAKRLGKSVLNRKTNQNTAGVGAFHAPLYDSAVPDPNNQPAVKKLSRDESMAALNQVIKGSEEVLGQASTVPILTLFPDTYTLDRTKVTITKRWFFRIADVVSMRVEDILHVNCSVGPFFGSVKIVSRVANNEQTYEIGPLWRNDAERLKRITHGYVIAMQRRIDTSSLKQKELTEMLDRLGWDDH